VQDANEERAGRKRSISGDLEIIAIQTPTTLKLIVGDGNTNAKKDRVGT
jgi:hypothetical protein